MAKVDDEAVNSAKETGSNTNGQSKNAGTEVDPDEVRKLVAEEGRSARNLLAWSVPLDSSGGAAKVKKPPLSPRPQAIKLVPFEGRQGTKRSLGDSHKKLRVRSASAGRDPKSDVRARYWAFLFENLRRAVDEIYEMCETDESIIECREAMMVLENYSKEFNSLVDWINLKKDYETTAPRNRPTSLSWEVRKSSPVKHRQLSSVEKNLKFCAVRAMRFDDGVCSEPFATSSIAVQTESLAVDVVQQANQHLPGQTPGSATNPSSARFAPVIATSSPKPLLKTQTSNLVHQHPPRGGAVGPAASLTPAGGVGIRPMLPRATHAGMRPILPVAPQHMPPRGRGAVQVGPRMTLASRLHSLNSGAPRNLPPSHPPCHQNKPIILLYHASQTASVNIQPAAVQQTTSKTLSDPVPVSFPIPIPTPPDGKGPPPARDQKNGSTSSLSSTSSSGKSWADKVKGCVPSSPQGEMPQNSLGEEDDNEGWETVQRNKFKSRSSPPYKSASVTNLNANKMKQDDNKPRAGSVPLSSRRGGGGGGGGKSGSSYGLRNGRAHAQSRQEWNKENRSNIARSLPSLHSKEPASEAKKSPNVPKIESEGSVPVVAVLVKAENPTRRKRAQSFPNISDDAKPQSFSISQEALKEEQNDEIVRRDDVLTEPDSKEKPSVGNEERPSEATPNVSCSTVKKSTTIQEDAVKMEPVKDMESLNVERIDDLESKSAEQKVVVGAVESTTDLKTSSNDAVEIEPMPSIESVVNDSSSGLYVTTEEPDDNSMLNVVPITDEPSADALPIKLEVKLGAKDVEFENGGKQDGNVEKENGASETKLSSMSKVSHLVLEDSKEPRSDDEEVLPLDHDIESAIQEEENLAKQIEETENADPEIEMDGSDATEGDHGLTPEEAAELSDMHQLQAETEQRLGKELDEMSWGDRMDCIEAEMRLPGRALHMHEKLSSPSRKRSLSESIRRHKIKQAKAQEQRERLLEEKAQKLRDLSKKVEEVRSWKEELLTRRRDMMTRKLERAEEKRRIQLQMIVKKAHDEEEKKNEIAFINSLEAQNKRHDVLSKIQGHEARLQDMQEERQRKQEEKAAKEAAVEERRRVLNAERQARILELQEKRKKKEHKIEQQQQEKEKERLEQAREKARDREERLSALHAAQQANAEELQKKIQQKQEESARRHEENIEHKRQKALELSILPYSSASDDAPRLVPYDTKKLCSVCNVLIASEVYLLSHIRGNKHQQAVRELQEEKELGSGEELEIYNLKHIIDAPSDKIDPQIALDRERQKALKKRCKKLRQRMTQRGTEYEALLGNKPLPIESPHKAKLLKFSKDVTKCFQQQGSGPWPNNLVCTLDRGLGEMARLLDKEVANDQLAMRACGGLSSIGQILNVISNSSSDVKPVIPSRSLTSACNLYRLACLNCYDNCYFIMYTNRIGTVVDLLIHRLNLLIPDNCTNVFPLVAGGTSNSLPVDPVASMLMEVITTVLTGITIKLEQSVVLPVISDQHGTGDKTTDTLQHRVQDVISYIISVGVVDKLAQYLNNVRGPIDAEPQVGEFLLHAMGLLTALTKLLYSRSSDMFERKKAEDGTQLVTSLRVTGLVGTVSLLYGMLLHSGTPSDGEARPPQFSHISTTVATAALRMLNHMALLHLNTFQVVVGDEGLSLEFRHITSYLLWYCTHWTSEALLHEVILVVGYFTVLNTENQMIIQSGHMPTVLQQLCSLPFQYFSNPELTNVLFPTLVACSYLNLQNKDILQQEMSCELLINFIEEKLIEQNRPTSDYVTKKAGSKAASMSWRWQLEKRFPTYKWKEAQEFFASVSGKGE